LAVGFKKFNEKEKVEEKVEEKQKDNSNFTDGSKIEFLNKTYSEK